MSETKTYVKWIRENSRVTLVLDRPEALNAVNTEVLMQLEECLDRIKHDPSIRFVVLTGAGERSFCAGGDICEQNENGVLQAVGFAENGHRVTRKLETLPCVTLAVVNGYALGGGCELALACDLRIATPNASFALPETHLGIIPGWGGTQRLPRLIGKGFAKEMIFTGERIKADKAYRFGLVNEIVERENTEEYIGKMQEQLAANSANAIRTAKRSIDEGYEMEIDQAFRHEILCYASTFAHPDQKEGMSAFEEKRKADFE